MSKAKSASRDLSTMASSRLPARNKLKRFAKQLRALAANGGKSRPFLPVISDELVEFVAGGIEKYLKGEYQSLDRALGLTRGRGRPQLPLGQGKHFELGKQLFWLRQEGKSWNQIGDLFPKYDERELQRIYKRYYEAAKADVVADIIGRLNE
jgi:hypothetical protein